MLPDFTGKKVLDLGCGYGWHCEYAADHGAVQVVGVDISREDAEGGRKPPQQRKYNVSVAALLKMRSLRKANLTLC